MDCHIVLASHNERKEIHIIGDLFIKDNIYNILEHIDCLSDYFIKDGKYSNQNDIISFCNRYRITRKKLISTLSTTCSKPFLYDLTCNHPIQNITKVFNNPLKDSTCIIMPILDPVERMDILDTILTYSPSRILVSGESIFEDEDLYTLTNKYLSRYTNAEIIKLSGKKIKDVLTDPNIYLSIRDKTYICLSSTHINKTRNILKEKFGDIKFFFFSSFKI